MKIILRYNCAHTEMCKTLNKWNSVNSAVNLLNVRY